MASKVGAIKNWFGDLSLIHWIFLLCFPSAGGVTAGAWFKVVEAWPWWVVIPAGMAVSIALMVVTLIAIKNIFGLPAAKTEGRDGESSLESPTLDVPIPQGAVTTPLRRRSVGIRASDGSVVLADGADVSGHDTGIVSEDSFVSARGVKASGTEDRRRRLIDEGRDIVVRYRKADMLVPFGDFVATERAFLEIQPHLSLEYSRWIVRQRESDQPDGPERRDLESGMFLRELARLETEWGL